MWYFGAGFPRVATRSCSGGEVGGCRAPDFWGKRLAFEGTSVSDPGLLSETPFGVFEMEVDGVKPQVGKGGDAV